MQTAERDPAVFLAKFSSLAREKGFRAETMGEVQGYPLLAFTKRTPGVLPRIYLSAGIHGDEPAPPLALLRLLEEGFFDRRAVWFLCPMLNPTGMVKGTRENFAGIDLNRDYRNTRSIEVSAHIRWLQNQPSFDLTCCVHEDWEAKGFYLYEINPQGRISSAEAMLVAVANHCLIDASERIDDWDAKGGIIRPTVDPATRELWAEALYLRQNHAQLGYTTETPSSFPLEQRIAAHRAALQVAVEAVVGR